MKWRTDAAVPSNLINELAPSLRHMLYDVNFVSNTKALWNPSQVYRVCAGQVPSPTCGSIAVGKIDDSRGVVADRDIVRSTETRGHCQ